MHLEQNLASRNLRGEKRVRLCKAYSQAAWFSMRFLERRDRTGRAERGFGNLYHSIILS